LTIEGVQELEERDQDLEAARVEGPEDAADRPERPIRTHDEYGGLMIHWPAKVSGRKKAS